jgi:hypothetical protein
MQGPRLVFSLALCLAVSARTFAASPTIRVEAGDLARHNCLVAFELPRGAEKVTHAKGPDGKLLPIQVDSSGKAAFILPDLDKGGHASYTLITSDTPPAAGVKLAREKDKLKATLAGRPLLEYQAEAGALPRETIRPVFKRGGYIHPLFAPSGKIVTDDFPPNHIHHHGVWWSWTKTEFQGRQPDFWNMGDAKGRVEFVGLGQTWSGPVHGGFTARHRFVDLTAAEPVIALNEVWEVRIYNSFDAPRGWIFDLISTQECATNATLKLPEYHYGGVGIRGNRAWDGKDNLKFLTSEGETNREKGNTTTGRWCDMSGLIDGSPAGITIFGHPGNFRAPQPMRLHPTEPFFCYAPQQAGEMEIAPGKTYVSRYRFVIHDGPPNKDFLEAVWNDFSNPPKTVLSTD